MEQNTVVPESPAPQEPVLSEQEIAAAVTNSPALSPDEFKLGDRTFKVVHLPYDDYVVFLSYLQPFLNALVGKLAEKANLAIPDLDLGESFEVSALVKFCLDSLPEMTRIVCKQSAPDITVEEIKVLAGTPFALADVVLKQVAKNRMIRDFADFFGRIAPLFKPG